MAKHDAMTDHAQEADLLDAGPLAESAAPYEIKAAVDELGRAFDAFKDSHEVSVRAPRDVLAEEKLDRISRDISALQNRLDRMHMAARRPALEGAGGAKGDPLAASEHKAAFYDRFVRKGLDGGLQELEAKALSVGTDSEGGYAVPEELDRRIEALLRDVSPIRRVAQVVRVGSANYRKLVNLGGTGTGWVGEADARTETTSPSFAEVVPPLGEIYANPAATQAMLDDAFFDVEGWLADEIAGEFGEMEGAAFVNGDGSKKPKGFLTYDTAATSDGTRAFGVLQHLATGVAGGFPASDPADKLIDLVHGLRPAYRTGAVFMMNTNVLASVRKFKDADGNYLWRPGLSEGMPATLLGYPVIEVPEMPDIAADSLSVAFGNFARGYVITDRTGVRLLRDPYSNKPYVHFYTTRRLGGGVVNSEAIKLLKFSA